MAGQRETPGERRDREQAMAAATDEPTPGRLWLPDSARTEPEPRRDAETLEVVEGSTAPTYGRQPGSGEQRFMVASGERIRLDDRKAVAATRRRRQAWQTEAWDYQAEVPEVGSTLDFVADLLSKLRLYPAVRPSPDAAPVPVDDEESGVPPDEAKIASATLDRLRGGQSGLGGLVGDVAFNLALAGECFLHAHIDSPTDGRQPVGEEWNIRSVDELVVQGDRFGLRSFAGSNTIELLPPDDEVFRLWRKDRRFGGMAMSHMRRLLSACENLLLLDRELRSAALSRVMNGFMLWPNGMSLGPVDPTRQGGDGQAVDDPFLADLLDAQVTAVQDPGSAAAFAPINVQGPDSVLEKVRHVKVERQIDGVLDQRIEAQIMRVARGLPMPVETTTGLAVTTYANAAVMKKSEWDAYGEPMAVLVVDAFTAAYYQAALEAAGIPWERARQHFIWFEPSDCIAAPDPVDNADYGHEKGIIKDETWRRLKGYTEADTPDDDEVMRRILFNSTRLDPFSQAQLLRESGLAPHLLIPAPQTGVIDPDTMEVTGGSSTGATPAVTAAAAPHGDGARLGQRLMLIDRDLRTRLRVAAELALKRTLEKAGNKVKAKAARAGGVAACGQAAAATITSSPARLVAAAAGRQVVEALGLDADTLTDGGFAELAEEFGAWVDVGYAQAIGEIEKAVGPLGDPARTQLLQAAQRGRDTAADWLQQQMTKLAAARLYNPEPAAPAVGEVASTVPEWIVRGATAVAGGDTPVGGEGSPMVGEDGQPVMGVATGPLVLQQVDGVEAYQWDYGSAPRAPFPPHEALDGVVADDPDGFPNDDGWPSDTAWPGDHDGCLEAGTVVAGPGAVHAMKRWYEGDALTFTFGSDETLTCTPNHPLLTAAGWRPAADVAVGTEVVGCDDPKRLAWLVDPDQCQMPTPIGEVFESFPVSLAQAKRTTPDEFHGDGAGSVTHLVLTNRERRDRCNTTGVEPGIDDLAAVAAGRGHGGFAEIADELRVISVVGVEHHRFSGPVYNLDSCAGWFIASGVVVGNCVCDIIPVLRLSSEAQGEGGAE